MLILHDTLSGDLSHIQAFADTAEGFALFDYVRIRQPDGQEWIPNMGDGTISRIDPATNTVVDTVPATPRP